MDTKQNIEKDTYQIVKPKRHRGPGKPREIVVEMEKDKLGDLSGKIQTQTLVDSSTQQIVELSNREGKKLKPPKVRTQTQIDTWARVLEENKTKRAQYKEYLKSVQDQKDLEQSQRLIQENKIKVVIKPKTKRPNVNHPLKVVKLPPPPQREAIVEVEDERPNNDDEILELKEKVQSTIQKVKSLNTPQLQPPVNPYLDLIKRRMS